MNKIATHDSATGEKGRGFLSFLVSPFSKTQSKTIQEQYDAGCRSFDIRVRRDKDGIFRCAHGLWMSKRYASDILSEINVFQRETDMSYSFADNRVVIVPLYNDLYYSINKGIVNNVSNTGTFSVRNYDTKLSTIHMNEYISIGPNAYYKFKAINGAWYAVDGVFTGE